MLAAPLLTHILKGKTLGRASAVRWLSAVALDFPQPIWHLIRWPLYFDHISGEPILTLGPIQILQHNKGERTSGGGAVISEVGLCVDVSIIEFSAVGWREKSTTVTQISLVVRRISLSSCPAALRFAVNILLQLMSFVPTEGTRLCYLDIGRRETREVGMFRWSLPTINGDHLWLVSNWDPGFRLSSSIAQHFRSNSHGKFRANGSTKQSVSGHASTI